MADLKERACPYCGESIRVTAVKCKHCASWVVPLEFDEGLRAALLERIGAGGTQQTMSAPVGLGGGSAVSCLEDCFVAWAKCDKDAGADPAKKKACDDASAECSMSCITKKVAGDLLAGIMA